MNVNKDSASPAAVSSLKADSTIPCRVALRQCNYLNDVIEQDHQVAKIEFRWSSAMDPFRALGGSRS
jgi:transposase-like protein